MSASVQSHGACHLRSTLSGSMGTACSFWTSTSSIWSAELSSFSSSGYFGDIAFGLVDKYVGASTGQSEAETRLKEQAYDGRRRLHLLLHLYKPSTAVTPPWKRQIATTSTRAGNAMCAMCTFMYRVQATRVYPRPPTCECQRNPYRYGVGGFCNDDLHCMQAIQGR